MKEIRTSIDIQAAPERVWNILTDFGMHEKWNPLIKSISGKTEVGQKLEVVIQPPGMSAMTMRPKVLEYDPNREFRWKGNLLFPGIFDGEHYFQLKVNEDGTTTFVHGEKFSGILVGLMSGVLKKTEKGFGLMNQALKTICEATM